RSSTTISTGASAHRCTTCSTRASATAKLWSPGWLPASRPRHEPIVAKGSRGSRWVPAPRRTSTPTPPPPPLPTPPRAAFPVPAPPRTRPPAPRPRRTSGPRADSRSISSRRPYTAAVIRSSTWMVHRGAGDVDTGPAAELGQDVGDVALYGAPGQQQLGGDVR